MENPDLLFIVVSVGYKGSFAKAQKNIKRNMAWLGTISFLTLHKTICCSAMTVLFLQWQDLQYLCIGALYVVVTNQWRMEQKKAVNNITAKHCMMVYEVEHSNVMMQQWIVWWCNSTSYEGATKHCSLCNRALWDGATENWMMMQHCIVWWFNNALNDCVKQIIVS